MSSMSTSAAARVWNYRSNAELYKFGHVVPSNRDLLELLWDTGPGVHVYNFGFVLVSHT